MTPADAERSALIYVCPVEALHAAARDTGASHLVTLINPISMAQIATPESVLRERHLRLEMNDITAPQDGMILPRPEHVASLVDFVRGWERDAPLLINCRAGRSRSPAAAFIAMCALNPGIKEKKIAALLGAAAPFARPNLLLVRYADDLLGRRGRMVAAIEGMRPGPDRPGALFGMPAILS